MKREPFPCPTAFLLVALAALQFAVLQVPAAASVAAPAASAATDPSAPQPAAAVQKLLEDAVRFAQAGQHREALKAGDGALAAARDARDPVGEARAHEARGRALESLGQTAAAVAAWRASALAWKRAGDGPGQVGALVAAARLLAPKKPAEAAALAAQAVALARAEGAHIGGGSRLLAAAQALVGGCSAGDHWGLLAHERALYAAAMECYQRLLALQETQAPGSRDVAQSLSRLGNLAWTQGDLRTAREYLQRRLEILEKLAPNSQEVAVELELLGRVSWRHGDLPAAEAYTRRALALFEVLAPDAPFVELGLNTLGNLALQRGDLEAAETYHRRVLALREAHAPGTVRVGWSLHNLGNVAAAQGDLAAAREYYRRALAIRETLLPNSLEPAGTLENLGLVACALGDLAAARTYNERALILRQKWGSKPLDTAQLLGNLGLIAQKQGELAAARGYYERALTIQKKLAPDFLDMAMSLSNLGAVADEQGDLAAAGAYYQRALGMQEKLAPSSPDMAGTLNRLGALARKQGELAAAEACHRRALAIHMKVAPHSLDMAETLHHLGLVSQGRGDWNEAERLARQAWELVHRQAAAVTGDEARQAWGTSTASYATTLVRAQIALGKQVPAFATLEQSRAQALQQLLRERRLDAGAAPDALWSAYREAVTVRDRAEQALSQASVAEAFARQALAAARPKGRERGAAARQVPGAPDAMTRAQGALDAAAKQSEEAQVAYTLGRVKADQLWAEIQRSAPRAFAPAISLEQARQALPADVLFVAFLVGEDRAYLFLLRPVADAHGAAAPPSLSVHPLTVTPQQLGDQVRRLRQLLTDPLSDMTETVTASRALFDLLFPGEARAVIRSARRLLISPDGPLWELPFAALVTNAGSPPAGLRPGLAGSRAGRPSTARLAAPPDPRYLGGEKAITYTQSLTLFAQSRGDALPPAQDGSAARGGAAAARRPRVGPPVAVVVGNPVFDRKTTRLASTAGNGYAGERSYLCSNGKPPAPLPWTEAEATAVARLYGGDLLTGERATEAALRERIESADLVHLATHGYLHPVRAMSSGVLLTVPEKESRIGETANDGALLAWEIYSQLKLKAELVVLSACETGRGQYVPGEGIVGLTRALQYAGARSLVASQWKVADQSTATLMVTFHRQLREGVAKDEALRRAMAAVRQNPKTRHPYYWAAFFLSGDPDNPNLAEKSG